MTAPKDFADRAAERIAEHLRFGELAAQHWLAAIIREEFYATLKTGTAIAVEERQQEAKQAIKQLVEAAGELKQNMSEQPPHYLDIDDMKQLFKALRPFEEDK